MNRASCRRAFATRLATQLFASALIMFIGCQSHRIPQRVQPPYTVYRSPQVLSAPPRRVLLMPVITPNYDGGFSEHWYRLFAAELRSIKQFEIVTTDVAVPCIPPCLESARRGQYDEATLVDVRDYFRVDGVMFVRMDDFFPYWPPRMAISVNLVDANHGGVTSSLDGNWDGRDDRIQLLAKDFAQHMTAVKETSDPDLIFQSPEYFGKFVAHQVAIAICQSFFDEQAVSLAANSSVGCDPRQLQPPVGVPVTAVNSLSAAPAATVGNPAWVAPPAPVGLPAAADSGTQVEVIPTPLSTERDAESRALDN